jgi:hypothetical protein
MLARKTKRYMVAAWEVRSGRRSDAASASRALDLDQEILERWIRYLQEPERDHPFLKAWDDATLRRGGGAPAPEEVERLAGELQEMAIAVFREKAAIDDRNYVLLGGAAGVKDQNKRQYTNIESLPPDKFYLWRDLASEPYRKSGLIFGGGIYFYGNAPPKRSLEEAGEEKQPQEGHRPLPARRVEGAARGDARRARGAEGRASARVSVLARSARQGEAGQPQGGDPRRCAEPRRRGAAPVPAHPV